MASKVRRVECGWGGHYVCADMCLFRRNTHLEKDGVWVVVSTVGNMYMPNSNKVSEISVGRFYETMVFLSYVDDNKYHDADVSKCIPTQGRWCIDKPNCDNEANDMHEAIVAEITERMESGTI